MAYHRIKSNSKTSEDKLIGTSLKDKNKPIENIKPIQKFNNREGCKVGVLAYCTILTGVNGAQNLVDALIADGRFGTVTLIDGDIVLPTAEYLLANFDSVIVVTDGFCSIPTPENISNSAANALVGFSQGGGGIVISTFSFSTCIGLGDAIFAPGFSPFQKVQCYNAFNSGVVDLESIGPNPICQCIFNGITGPINVNGFFYGNYVTLSPGATLCATYTDGLGFAAVNSTGNILGLNTFPFYAPDIENEQYRRIVANALLCVCRQKPTRGIKFSSLLNIK